MTKKQFIIKKGRSALRPMQNNFRKFLADVKPADNELPLTHVTDGYRFRSILESMKINTQECSIFKKPLVYLFYGRPAYRVNQAAKSSSIQAYAPVCFLIDPTFDLAISGVFPFDTGAFHREMLERAFHEEMQKEDFALDLDLDSPRRLVRLFFGDMNNYFKASPTKELKIPSMEFEATSYHGLILDEGKNDYDDRISAIEIHVEKDLDLTHSVLAIIVPETFLDNDKVINFAKNIRAEILTYDYIGRMKPEQYVSTIYSIVRTFYRKNGYLP